MHDTHGAEIVDLYKESIKQLDSKKYKILKISFGTVQGKALKIGATVDISGVDFEQVALLSEGKPIAEGTLVNVDEEIAIQIKKVN